ncbi:LysM peptidoglycan-binding domain-containing protein [Paenibacillus flagellatus]|uniref:LysM domain-containing protein n=1 Tax=Paenibacillus flagellatus TaxID=2211139 RepID=A0A2V5KSV8_9BACL|nr:LysM peptidoglycan-binding domain-containing protein [Paenibacillus flagellatus]PYI52216.1 hypothetical protein DLM86_22350 [Paenibacillus flagellatus]
MSEQQSGLRFDIYERVHLPEEVSAIVELDEVELSPQIRVAVEGDQAVVKGCLLLTGTYTGQAEGDARETKALEHTIPVEITLPMSRIRSVEDISVEIDNFDVDLLSERSLNVTGVLSLNGIEMVSGGASEAWRDEEEVVFVHEAAQADESPQYGDISLPPRQMNVPRAGFWAEAAEEPEVPASAHEAEPETEPAVPVVAEAEAEAASEPVVPVFAETSAGPIRDQLPEDTYEDYEVLANYDSLKTEGAPEEDAVSAAEAVEASVQEEPDKGEMKIAFGSKKAEAGQPFDLKSYVSKTDEYRFSGPTRGYRNEPAPVPAAAPVAETGGADALEWKNLFLSASEEQQFRKVRLCIVHKDDTIESIAKKYDRKPQEIRLYNGLSDQDVSEGQVIYIP